MVTSYFSERSVSCHGAVIIESENPWGDSIFKTLVTRIILKLKKLDAEFWNLESRRFESHKYQLKSRQFESRQLELHRFDYCQLTKK